MTTLLDTPFEDFPKMARLSRRCVITEKIDGTNAQIFISDDDQFLVGSRTRWITPQQDNMGFARWAYEHEDELRQLGRGRHFGEWWGAGIQRTYGQKQKQFSLFNSLRWVEKGGVLADKQMHAPDCCRIVPVLYDGMFSTGSVDLILRNLKDNGSQAAPGFMDPEGIIVYHVAAGIGFKKTIKNDETPKSLQ